MPTPRELPPVVSWFVSSFNNHTARISVSGLRVSNDTIALKLYPRMHDSLEKSYTGLKRFLADFLIGNLIVLGILHHKRSGYVARGTSEEKSHHTHSVLCKVKPLAARLLRKDVTSIQAF